MKQTSKVICGFVLVRRPSENRDEEGRGVFPRTLPSIDGLLYVGLDRMPWFDIDEVYYGDRPDDAIRRLKEQIRQANADLTGIELVQDVSLLEQAVTLLGEKAALNEAIAVHSSLLASIKGEVTTHLPLTWVGYDVISLGGGSLLREGLYGSTWRAEGWRQRLNANGLLESVVDCQLYWKAYEEWAQHIRNEPVDARTVDFVEVHRLEGYPWG